MSALNTAVGLSVNGVPDAPIFPHNGGFPHNDGTKTLRLACQITRCPVCHQTLETLKNGEFPAETRQSGHYVSV